MLPNAVHSAAPKISAETFSFQWFPGILLIKYRINRKTAHLTIPCVGSLIRAFSIIEAIYEKKQIKINTFTAELFWALLRKR